MDEPRAIEAIKQLKARYFRFMDTKQWDAWRELFTDDVTIRVDTNSTTWGRAPTPPTEWQGRDRFVSEVSVQIGDAITVHHGHMPEIELTSESTAKGVWAMADIVERSTYLLQGHGHYHETYELADGHWRIKSMHLTRLRLSTLARTAPNC